MAPEIGFASLLLALILTLFLPILNFTGPKLSKNFSPHLLQLSQYFTITISALCSCAMLCLIYSYIISDFSVLNVYQNSHNLKPLIYKISGSWGSHEGSILLLTTILSFYSLAFAFLSKVADKHKILIISCQSIITFGILAFTVFTSNPFVRIFPTPKSGLGLNPVLQDIGLAMHPPMLYAGYIGFSLIFSFAISALLDKKIDKNFAAHIKPWLIFSWSFLTLGIGLGSWWAYRELGWGGYWFWDPVENVSLMPWLCATALLHSVIILNKTGNFRILTCFLSILSFIFCLLGVFLVRSGILTSIHSFANDPKRGIFIILLLFTIGGSGFLIFFIQSLKIKVEKNEFALTSKTGLILINNFILCLALFIVVLGTLYPLILQLLFDTKISIGPFYYQKLLSPLSLVILFLMIFAPYLKLTSFTNLSKKTLSRGSAILLLSALVTSLLFLADFEIKILPLIAIFLSLSVLFSGLIYLKNQKINLNYLAMIIGHAGIALVIIGIGASSLLSKSTEVNVKLGDQIKIANYEIKFDSLDYKAGKNYITRIGIFKITNKKNHFYLKPELRYYPVSDQTTTEASIKHQIFHDLYLVLGNKDENENFAVRVYYKPFISLLWVGCLFLFCAGLLSLFKVINKKR